MLQKYPFQFNVTFQQEFKKNFEQRRLGRSIVVGQWNTTFSRISHFNFSLSCVYYHYLFLSSLHTLSLYFVYITILSLSLSSDHKFAVTHICTVGLFSFILKHSLSLSLSFNLSSNPIFTHKLTLSISLCLSHTYFVTNNHIISPF